MKVFLDSIGCRLNQSEIERIALQFRSAGHEIVENAQSAELVVVNTCAVTGEAVSDSRQKIRQVHRAGSAVVAATGCWATLDPEAAVTLPAVQWVIPNDRKDQLVADILHIHTEEMDLEPLSRQPLPGIHQRTRAFIKIQDGCDNFCTFCITRLARGSGRSLPAKKVIEDIGRALDGGAKEIVLTGVHLGSWGQDFEQPLSLRFLLEMILNIPDIQRLRLSSLEPWDLDRDFFNLWHDRRLCRHLHLPLQSGCAATLRRMARKITPWSFASLVDIARNAVPSMAITTDIIAGFPGETEEEFLETIAYVGKLQFAGGHVFTFSARPGTAAARLPDQVPLPIRKQRNAILREALAEAAFQYRRQYVGQIMPVLWEASSGLGPGGWSLEGLTDNYLRVKAYSPLRLWNQFSSVELTACDERGMAGMIQEETLNHPGLG